ncbi:MAG: hypothetical protein GY820_00580 [Gammaproteobacteria bacterium]|nr:hypothetical protein [Gammaproteobacteria bacterium]
MHCAKHRHVQGVFSPPPPPPPPPGRRVYLEFLKLNPSRIFKITLVRRNSEISDDSGKGAKTEFRDFKTFWIKSIRRLRCPPKKTHKNATTAESVF